MTKRFEVVHVDTEVRNRNMTAAVSLDRVLVVDDEKAVVDILVAYLKTIGIEQVDSCTTENCFADYFRPDKYQLVIVDLNLNPNKEMCGFEVVKQIRELDHNVLVIVITGYPQSLINKQLISSGIDDFLIKPLTLETFAYRILLNLSRSKRQRRFGLDIHNRYDERLTELRRQADEIGKKMSSLLLGESDAREGREACSGTY